MYLYFFFFGKNIKVDDGIRVNVYERAQYPVVKDTHLHASCWETAAQTDKTWSVYI